MVYAFAAALRDATERDGAATWWLDLLPQHSAEQVLAAVQRGRGARSLATHLKSTLKLQGVKLALLREVLGAPAMADAAALAAGIKALPLKLAAPRPVAEAISTAGGTLEHEESHALGERLLAQALRAEGLPMPESEQEAPALAPLWQQLLRWSGNRSRSELLVDIALGRKIASMVAKRLARLLSDQGARPDAVTLTLGLYAQDDAGASHHIVTIDGSEGASVQLATCCRPIPGDAIRGYLGRGEGLLVSDVFGFRVIVPTQADCYLALGVLHALYKPVPGRFKDFVAIPKVNGYQSLHTTLVSPLGTPVEFQIRTDIMHAVAETGIAAHWLYKTGDKGKGKAADEAQRMGAMWLQSLLDIQGDTVDSAEFLEHVKIDLFPDAVYVFTPRSKIM
ncbi:hypothetical protein B566_EDAN019408, partial [Ephemera danica]